MTVSMDDVKKLREETSAGVMDAKRALEESGGDMKKAREWIKKKGLSRAESKADRETGVRRVFAYIHHNGSVGSLVELLCETDFVANTDDFTNLGKEVAMQVASMNPKSANELMTQDYLREPSKTIGELVKEVSGKTGENIRIGEIARV